MSSLGYGIATAEGFGGTGYTAVQENYDADNRADAAVYNTANGNWTVLMSAQNYITATLWGFGGAGYMPVSGDFDGDGLADLAVINRPRPMDRLVHEDEEVTDLNVMAAMYSNAMVNASNVVAGKIRCDLTPITTDNTNLIWRTNPTNGVREVLVASYMSAYAATHFYHVGQNSTLTNVGAEAWVTLVPELKNFCRNYAGTNIYLRLKQLMGLPATGIYGLHDTIVEFMWIRNTCCGPRATRKSPTRKPKYRSAPTPSMPPWSAPITPPGSKAQLKAVITVWTNGVWNAWPWTQLGYTYDWSKTGNNVMGVSEYVVPGKMLYNQFGVTSLAVYVVSVTSALSYATSPDDPSVQPQGDIINVAMPE